MMNRVMLMFVMLVLVAAVAQAQEARVEKGEREGRSEQVGSNPPSTFAETASPVPELSAAPPPVPQAARRRRRGSMVGYVADATVESKVRIRFDTGLHNEVPDRAEFFYAKCGCYRDLPPSDAAFDSDAPGPRPGAASDLNFQQLVIEGEYALTPRFSAFAGFPLRWIQPQAFIPGTGGSFPNQGGFGDLRAGVKLALTDTPDQAVTVQVQTSLPTGDAGKGLGTDHATIEPAFLYYQRVADRWLIETQIGDWHPFGGSAGVPTTTDEEFSGDVFFYGGGVSYELYQGNRAQFAPVVELVGWRVLGGFQTSATADASGTNIVNLKIGARTSWDDQGSFYIGYGHALTSDDWYNNIVRFEYRYSF